MGIPTGYKQTGLTFPAALQASCSKHMAMAARAVVPSLCLGGCGLGNVHSSKDTGEASPIALMGTA